MRETGVREESLHTCTGSITCKHSFTHTHLTYRVGEGLLLCFPSQTGQWDKSEQWWTGTGNRRSFRT